MLGYMHNAGTCKMVYGSYSVPPTPLSQPRLRRARTLAVLLPRQVTEAEKYQATCCGDDFAADIVVVCVCVCLVVVKLQQAFGLHSIIFEFQQQANK